MEEIIQNQSETIKLRKMSKGYNWEIKLVDWESDQEVIGRLEKIDNALKEKYPKFEEEQ